MANFEKAFKKILFFEGGYSNNKYDSGGETKYGITLKTARSNKYIGEMKDFPLDLAKKIYKKDYWDTIKGDNIDSQKIAETIFNVGINIGVKRASLIIQKVLNALNNRGRYWKELKVDGTFGNISVKTLNKAIKKKYYIEENINFLFIIKVGNRYYDIVLKKENQEIFLNGWIKRLKNFV